MKSIPLLIALLTAVVLSACGSDSVAEAELPPAASEGRAVAQRKGCAACHGSDGGGGIGPAFVGLYGSEVTIEGQSEPVIADREYLVRSILEPSAQIVEGYRIAMPQVDLTDDEIEAVIAYIEALAEGSP